MTYLLSSTSVLIIFFGIVNLVRMTIFLIGSDIYILRKHLARNKKPKYYPTISVIVPAYNEVKSIVSSVSSVLNNSYPQEKVEIIVVNDGSTDKTEQVIKDFTLSRRAQNVTIVSQENKGKAHALNNAIKNFATGELIMCLDADSYLAKHALLRAITYFENKKIVAVASNVKIAKSEGILNLIQMFEYIICYQMKKAQTVYNIEYIIGGIGSMFRRNLLEEIGFYDTDTVTEDIDLTMKILRFGNKNVRFVYGSDVIAYTQSVFSLPDLIRQRHRWKWGRYQTFLKNKDMFFSKEEKHTKVFSWFYLPFALYCDLAFFFEPLILSYMLYLIIGYKDILTLILAVCVITFYMSMSILAEETVSLKDKIRLITLTPFMYFLFYLLSYVEYVALIKSFIKLKDLDKSLLLNISSWNPISRKGLLIAQTDVE